MTDINAIERVVESWRIGPWMSDVKALIAEVKAARAWFKEEKAFQEFQPDDWCTSRACWAAQEEYRQIVEQNTRDEQHDAEGKT